MITTNENTNLEACLLKRRKHIVAIDSMNMREVDIWKQTISPGPLKLSNPHLSLISSHRTASSIPACTHPPVVGRYLQL